LKNMYAALYHTLLKIKAIYWHQWIGEESLMESSHSTKGYL